VFEIGQIVHDRLKIKEEVPPEQAEPLGEF